VAMKVRAFALRSLSPSRVRVVIDGTEVADWLFTTNAAEVRTFPIPPSAVTPFGAVTVHFEMPDAHRPIDFGVSSETRLLGLGAASLRIIRAQ
jgi:sarcosine oxidase gamma subunit